MPRNPSYNAHQFSFSGLSFVYKTWYIIDISAHLFVMLKFIGLTFLIEFREPRS